MLQRVLGVDADGDIRQAVERLIAERAPETQHLDFKQEPPTSPDAKRKAAERIAAMANGGGGIFVIGVEEEDSRASGARIFPLGGEEERLRQIVSSLVQPYLRIRTLPVPVDANGNGFLVVEVPASASYPHALARDHRLTYPRRELNVTGYMTEAEVARAYRDRREQELHRLDEADTLQKESESRLKGGGLVFICVPQELGGRRLPSMKQAREQITDLIRRNGIVDVMNEAALGADTRIRFRRIEIAHSWTDDTLQKLGWATIGDRGEYACVRPAWDTTRIQSVAGTNAPPHHVTPYSLLKATTTALVGYRALTELFGMSGEVLVRVGLRVRPRLAYYQFPEGFPDSLGEATESAHVDSIMDADELMTGDALCRTARRLLDDVVTTFGQADFPVISDDGAIVEAFIDSKQRLRRWAEVYGVRVV